MYLDKAKVRTVFEDKGVTELYHANSVVTACHFLRQKRLLSRGTLIREGKPQTPQYSDMMDQRYNLWYDIFMDTVDIHKQGSVFNNYGPVLFVFDIGFLKSRAAAIGSGVWVSKLNPTKFLGVREKDRWFQDINELESEFQKNKFDQMLVFRHCGGIIPLTKKYLKKIILDDPGLEDECSVNIYSQAYGALRNAMSDGQIDVPIEKRTCRRSCGCHDAFTSCTPKIELMFSPFYLPEEM